MIKFNASKNEIQLITEKSNQLTIKCGSFGDFLVDAMHAAPLQDVATVFAARANVRAYGTRLCCRIFAANVVQAEFDAKDGKIENFSLVLAR